MPSDSLTMLETGGEAGRKGPAKSLIMFKSEKETGAVSMPAAAEGAFAGNAATKLLIQNQIVGWVLLPVYENRPFPGRRKRGDEEAGPPGLLPPAILNFEPVWDSKNRVSSCCGRSGVAMSEDHHDDISFQDTMIEVNILLGLAATLNRQVVPDEELQHFDTLSAFTREHGGSLVEASQATAVPVTRGVIVIVLLGLIHNWWDGGADAAIALPGPDEFDQMMKSQRAPEHDELPLTVKAVKAMGFARAIDSREYWVEVGEILQELENVILFGTDTELAVQMALATYDLLSACGHEGAALSQIMAYRLLVWSRRLPFLADLAPSKYPPPLVPRVTSGDQLELSLTFIRQGILDQPLDLGINAREMVEDPDAVIDNNAEVEIGGIRQTLRFELTFAPELLAWALDDNSVESLQFGADADIKLRMMLEICCENRTFLERHRDEDLFDIYTMAYIGTEPASDRRLGFVMKIETMGQMMRCIIGLSEEDVSQRGAYGRLAAVKEAELMAHLAATIRARP